LVRIGPDKSPSRLEPLRGHGSTSISRA
jgi:hypothetical protein